MCCSVLRAHAPLSVMLLRDVHMCSSQVGSAWAATISACTYHDLYAVLVALAFSARFLSACHSISLPLSPCLRQASLPRAFFLFQFLFCSCSLFLPLPLPATISHALSLSRYILHWLFPPLFLVLSFSLSLHHCLHHFSIPPSNCLFPSPHLPFFQTPPSSALPSLS